MFDVLTRTIMKNNEPDIVMRGKNVEVGFDRIVIVTSSLLNELNECDICHRDYMNWAEGILILHGTLDEVVPFGADKIFAEDIVIDIIPVLGADHGFQNHAHTSVANKYAMEFFGFR